MSAQHVVISKHGRYCLSTAMHVIYKHSRYCLSNAMHGIAK